MAALHHDTEPTNLLSHDLMCGSNLHYARLMCPVRGQGVREWRDSNFSSSEFVPKSITQTVLALLVSSKETKVQISVPLEFSRGVRRFGGWV